MNTDLTNLHIDDHVEITIGPKSIMTPFRDTKLKDGKGIHIGPYNFRRFQGKEGLIDAVLVDIKMHDNVIEYLTLEQNDFTYKITPDVITKVSVLSAKPYKG